jgi:DNA-binding NarL/FixJ family response regulator
MAATTGDGAVAALSPREREVAALVADGRTNAQIAARLHLSESTVEKHVSRVLAKLGMSSRAGVAGLLARDR